jgi:sodium/hydrogen exchanger-like protein 6/7/sodium/hydrogen exchanger 8
MEDNSETQFHWFTPLELIGRFIENCLLSCLVGLIVGIFLFKKCSLFLGLFSTWVFKTCRFLNQSTTAETVFAFLMAYFGYTICEMFDLSGVISLLMIGIIMTHY